MKDDLPQTRSKNAVRIRQFSKSGLMTPVLIGLVCLALLLAAFLRGHGNVRKIRDAVDTTLNPAIPNLTPKVTGPGGQDAIKLTRSAVEIGKDIEFLSATLLPGRGMSLLQITAMVPGRGEVPLLVAPDVDTLGSVLNGKNGDEHGEASMTMGGAFLLPWAGRMSGEPTGQPGILGRPWQGTQLTFPAIAPDSTISTDGLFLDRASDSVKSDVLPDGQFAQAVFHTRNFGGQWPSTVDVTVTIELSAQTLDMTVSATNTGKVATPFGVGWHPLFVLPSGNRADAMVSIPSDVALEMNRKTGLPTGKTVATPGTPLDFNRPKGVRLGSQDLDATYVKLQTGTNAVHPTAEIRDGASNLSLKIIPLSDNITNLHVVAPADKRWISIGPATDVAEAMGSQWGQGTETITLAPGQMTQWKVRLEIGGLDAELQRN